MTWNVRQAEAADLDAVSALLKELALSVGVAMWAPAQLRAFLAAELLSPARCFLLAERGARPAGLCGLRFAPCLWTLRPAGEVLELVVTASQRGTGGGRALWEAARAEAARRQCSHLWVLTERHNNAARSFYGHLGLVEKRASYFEAGLRRAAGAAPPTPPLSSS